MSVMNLEQYQTRMGAYLRNPEFTSMPSKLDKQRAEVYKDLVFANIESQLSGSFPVISSVLDGAQWRALVREFLSDYRAQTPYFTQLSGEFVTFLAQRDKTEAIPPFLLELAHYERAEIELFMQDEEYERMALSSNDLLSGSLGLVSTVSLLAYAYPVHRIGPEYQPEDAPELPTFLLLFQDDNGEVRFFELQPLAYQLALQISEGNKQSSLELLEDLANAIGLPFTVLFQEQGLQLLAQLNDLKVLRIEQ